MKNKLLIYLANLSHIRDGVASTESIPINIGYLAAYASEKMPESFEIKLFNNPFELEEALSRQKPDVLGASNYSWNFYLNYLFISAYKKKYPQMVTLMGGPNYPGNPTQQIDFLMKFQDIDFYIFMEGERPFSQLLNSVIEEKYDIETIKKKKIPGLHAVSDGKFYDGGLASRVDLKELPSPYTKGILDGFLLNGFAPILQTNRGCPFECSYCYASNKYFRKISCFPLEYVKEEIEYIANRTTSPLLHIADSNYGIFKHDSEISDKLINMQKKYGWPLKINVSTAKVSKEQVFNTIKDFKDSIYFSASMQSMNQTTLEHIKRKNLAFEEYLDILKNLTVYKVKSRTEFIIGMPGETYESQLHGLRTAIEAQVDMLSVFSCMILPNTPLSENSFYNRFNMDLRWRIVPRDFGSYLGEKVLEVEKVCVATESLAFDEYVKLRCFYFIIQAFYNHALFQELIAYFRSVQYDVFDWLMLLNEHISKAASSCYEVYKGFENETKAELWDTEEELLTYYQKQKNFDKLFSGEAGANLCQKYVALFISRLQEFSDYNLTVLDKYTDLNLTFVENIIKFCTSSRADLFNLEKEETIEVFDFDIIKWIEDGMNSCPSEYNGKTQVHFILLPEQKQIIERLFAVYGSSPDSRGKILTRINPATLFRKYIKIQ